MKTIKLNATQRTVIEKNGKLTNGMREKLFWRENVEYIRDCLEENGFDRHLMIEFESTEVAVVVAGRSIYMEVRKEEKNKLGLWGGPVIDGLEPSESAKRRLYAETGLLVNANRLEPRGINEHKHVYANGDVAYFIAHRYVAREAYVPEFSSVEYALVKKGSPNIENVLEQQKEFVRNLLRECYK